MPGSAHGKPIEDQDSKADPAPPAVGRTLSAQRVPAVCSCSQSPRRGWVFEGCAARGAGVAVADRACESWFKANPSKSAYKPAKYIGTGTGSHRYDGVTALASEIDPLLTTPFAQTFATAKRMMGTDDPRIGDRKAETLSSPESFAEFQDPRHRSKATVLKQQYDLWNNPTGLTFQAWLADKSIQSSKDAQDHIDLMWPDSCTGSAKEVVYLDDQARIPYRLVCRGGLYDRTIDGGAPFHSGNHRTGDGDLNKGWAIFVMSPSVQELYRDMEAAVGRDPARAYLDTGFKLSLDHGANGFQGPDYNALKFLESGGKAKTTVAAPTKPT